MTATPSKRIGCSPWAFIGCECGFVAMLGVLLVFLLLTVEHIWERQAPNRDREAYVRCQHNLLHLRQAIDSFAKDHGRVPASLEELEADPRYYENRDWFACPLAHPDDRAYRYHADATAPEDALVSCTRHGQGPLILQGNGQLRMPREARPLFPARRDAPPLPEKSE